MSYQAQLLRQIFVKQRNEGYPGKIQGEIGFINNTKEIIRLNTIRIKKSSYYFNFTPNQKMIRPKQRFSFKFSGHIKKVGKFQIIAKIPILDSKGKSVLGHYSLDLYYKVKGLRGRPQSFKVSNYKALFLDDGAYKEPGMGKVFKSQKENRRY